MELYRAVIDLLWSPSIWLPPGKNWDDMKSTEERLMPDFEDLKKCALYLPIIFIILRQFLVEPFLLRPIGRLIGMRESPCRPPPPNSLLESLHSAHRKRKIDHEVIISASMKTGWSERQIERWLRQRKASERVTQMFKFCDCSWELCYYLFYFSYSVYLLRDKPWLWDMSECWRDYPFHAFDPDLWWYYMIPLGFYLSSTATFLMQHQRKDALQMLLHHLVTLFLIVVSWAVNLTKAGSLILLVHECADIPLQSAKIAGYAGKPKLMDIFFGLFLLTWCVTRLGFFPFWIMRKSIFESYHYVERLYPIYYILNSLLVVLLCMHVLWTILIVRIIKQKFESNRMKDVRSDSEELTEEELFDASKNEINGNGVVVTDSHMKQS